MRLAKRMNKSFFKLVCILGVPAVVGIFNFGVDEMLQIKFAVGKNIHDTAKRSGAPKYATRNVAGLVSYKLIDLPSDIALVYDVPEHEIKSLPIFAFTLYADKDSNNDLAVEAASLQFHTDAINSHESAKAFVERLISQFTQGKWRRFVPELCPAVTGRSSFLDEEEQVEQIWNCPVDPTYRMTMDEWVALMAMTQNYQWLGNGVLATLTVGFSNDSRGITYSIQLNFDDIVIKARRENTNERQKLEEGDAEGRNSSATHAAELLKAKARIAILEENARKRGDAFFPR